MINVRKVTQSLFRRLQDAGFTYCIYNGYENLPDSVTSDLDIAIESKALQYLDGIILEIAKLNDILLLSKIWHDNHKIAYILSPYSLANPERLHLDFFSEFSIKGYKRFAIRENYHFLGEADLLDDSRDFLYFKIPPPSRELLFKFVRRMLKGDLDNDKFSSLCRLYSMDPFEARLELERILPTEVIPEVIRSLEKHELEHLAQQSPVIKGALGGFKKSLYNPFILTMNLKRALYRSLFPVGITVAFLGPDGSGKTTCAKNILRLLSRSFHKQAHFYWRPGLLKAPGVLLHLRQEQEGEMNPNPHGHERESFLKSQLRFFYYLVDFIIGDLWKIRLSKIRKCFCVFDRHYYDILVDRFRYNFSLPEWMLKLGAAIVPKPDLVFYLHNSLSTLIERKQELPQGEIERQINGYINLVKRLPTAYIINNEDNIQQVLAKLSSIIILNNHYDTYFSLNLVHGNTGDKSFFQTVCKELFGIEANYVNDRSELKMAPFPNRGNPKILIPMMNKKVFQSSLQLYTPSRGYARFAKKLALLVGYHLLKRANSHNFYALKDTQLMRRLKDLFPETTCFAVYMGVPGPHRMPVLQLMDNQGKILGYTKVGLNEKTRQLLVKEGQTLRQLKDLDIRSALLPEKLADEDMGDMRILVNKSSGVPAKTMRDLAPSHLQFLKELLDKTSKDVVFGESEFCGRLVDRIHFLKGKISTLWTKRYEIVLERLRNESVLLYTAHGDFTPWNVFSVNGKLLVIDWPYSHESVELYDLFHFIVHSVTFAQKRPQKLDKLLEKVRKSVENLTTATSSKLSMHWEHLFLIYLTDVSTFYFWRNLHAGYVEKDLRLEITWSKLFDKMFLMQEIAI